MVSMFDAVIFDDNIFDTEDKTNLFNFTTILRAVTSITTILRVVTGNTTVLRATIDNTTIKDVNSTE